MVAPPKTLQDLRKVEGAVRITCRACGHVRLYDREQMIIDRGFARQSCDWSIVLRDQRCWKCSGTDVRVEGVPFAKDAAELRRRRATMLMVNLALTTLEEAARRSARERPDEAPVRLALRVLHPHVGDAEMLTEFWRQAMEHDGKAGSHPHLVIRWMIGRLTARGYSVWAELR